MTRTTNSWLSTREGPAALLDELVKIGEDAAKHNNRNQLLQAAKAIGAAGAGAGLGAGAYHGLRAIPKVRGLLDAASVSPGKLKAVRLGLPILGAIGGMMGSRYRKKMKASLPDK